MKSFRKFHSSDGGEDRMAIVFFVDLVGSASVSSEKSLASFWDEYIRHYYAAIEFALGAYRKEAELVYISRDFQSPEFGSLIQYRGDEVVGFLNFPKTVNKRILDQAVVEVIRFVYALKILWLASRYNLNRIHEGQMPREISVGIHMGPIRLVENQNDKTLYHVGYTINVAKRVEGASRIGDSSHILVTAEVREAYRRWILSNKAEDTFSMRGIEFQRLGSEVQEKFKGIDPPPEVWELVPSKHAERVMRRLKNNLSWHVHKNLRKGIGEPLVSGKNPWLVKNDKRIEWDDIKRIIERFSATSNLWNQVNYCLLVTACENISGKPAVKNILGKVALRLHENG